VGTENRVAACHRVDPDLDHSESSLEPERDRVVGEQ
jgi:hypothetical protein